MGSPPGYVELQAGQLTEAIRRKPFLGRLFDEIKKAHPDIFNTPCCRSSKRNRLYDSQGRSVDFRNTVLIMSVEPGHPGPAQGLPGLREV